MFETGNHRGPARTYRPEHVVYLMILLRENGRMSRRSISESMGIGEGSVRSLLGFLASREMVSISRRGVTLSPDGIDYVDGLNLMLVPMGVCGGVVLVAAVVKGAAGNMGDGLLPVFDAIRAGADDVSVYRMDGGMVPVQSYAPDLGKDTEDYDLPCADDGDAVAICGSPSLSGAKLAAVAAGIGFMRSAQGECRWPAGTGNSDRSIRATGAGTCGTARARRGPTSVPSADRRCGTGPAPSRTRATCAGIPGSPGAGRYPPNAPSAGPRNGGFRGTGCNV